MTTENTDSLAWIATSKVVTLSLTASHEIGNHSTTGKVSFQYKVKAMFTSCLENVITSSIVRGFR